MSTRGLRRAAGIVPLLLVAAGCGFAWLSCLPHQQFRRVPASRPAALELPLDDDAPARENDPRARELAGHSLFRYGGADPSRPGYSLGVVEFDDQGFQWDERQVATLREHAIAVGRDRGIILITFMHGWNHTAAVGDNNIGCFQEVLEAVARLEHAWNGAKSRAVVGVYLGWRARLFRPTWLNRATTFWDRMAAADRIGDRGELVNVLAQLAALRREVHGARPNIVVLTAHSMGARAMFSAVGGHLKASLARAAVGEAEVEGFGDMMILVNPALSAADYRVVDRLSAAARADERRGREPLLVLISSTGDHVLRRLYPLGAWASNWTHSAGPGIDRRILRTTAAAYAPYVTHRLRVAEGAVPPLPGTGERDTCRCRSLVAADLPSVRRLSAGTLDDNLLQYRDLRVADRDASGRPRLLYRLALEPVRTPETRLMVIETEPAVMPDHGEMYTPALVEFLVRLVNARSAAGARAAPDSAARSR